MMPPSETDDRLERIREEAHEWVSRILDDPKTHEPGLRAWVGDDQERADSYNAIYRQTAKAGQRGLSLFGRLRDRQARRSIPQVRTIPFGRIVGLSFALILMGTVISLGLSALSGHLSSEPAVAHREQLVSTDVGEIRTIALPDGSRVTLDTASSIRIAYSSRERRVELLGGRARFDILHNDRLPFRLYAHGMTVTDRGTVFDVDTNGGLKVRLLKGAADVTPPAGHDPNAPRLIHLKPGETLRFASTASPAMQTRPMPERWIDGQQTFDDVPASEVVREANRYSTTQIEFADPSIGDESVFLDVDVRNTHLVAEQIASILRLDLDDSLKAKIMLKRKS